MQDVNDATPKMAPKDAATHVGGIPLMAPAIASQNGGGACAVADYIKFIVAHL